MNYSFWFLNRRSPITGHGQSYGHSSGGGGGGSSEERRWRMCLHKTCIRICYIYIICSTSVALSFLIFSSKRRFQLAIISAGHLSMCDPQMAFVFLKRNKQRLYNWNSLSSVFLSAGYSCLSLFQMTGHLLSRNRPTHSTEKELQNEFQNRHCSLNTIKHGKIWTEFSFLFREYLKKKNVSHCVTALHVAFWIPLLENSCQITNN